MSRLISLLRGINVGGHKKISMAELKSLYEGLGFTEVVTYIQSGNVVFTASSDDDLSANIKRAIQDYFGFELEIILRTHTAWREIIEGNPFPSQAKNDPQYLNVILPTQAPSPEKLDAARAFTFAGSEIFAIHPDVIYGYYADGYGRSRYSNPFWEKMLNVPTTTRNWNSMKRLLALAEGD